MKAFAYRAMAGLIVAARWSKEAGGKRIQISANYYDDSANEKPGTRVAITKAH